MFTGVFCFQACLALFLFKCGKVRVSALRLPKHCRNICRNAETRTAQGSNKHALGRVGAGKKLFQPVSRVPVRGQPGRFNPPMCRLRQPCGRPRVPGWRGVADLPLVPRPAGPVISPRASPPPVPLRSDQLARLASVPGVRSDSADARMRISPARLLPGAEGARSRSFPWVYRGGLYAHAVAYLPLARARRRDNPPRPPTPGPGPMGGMGLRLLAGASAETGDSMRSRPMALFSIASVLGRGLPRVRLRVWFG